MGGDYGPYIQTAAARPLSALCARSWSRRGHAYYCFCTKERLDEARAEAEQEGRDLQVRQALPPPLPRRKIKRRLEAGEPYVIRQNVPTEGKAGFDDVIYGHVEVDCDTLDDNVLIKADGLPTYNFANVIDDHLMGITHVMRGNEYLSSAPKYNLLYEAFGWTPPTYVHLTRGHAPTPQRKLSKRKGDPSFEDLLDHGLSAPKRSSTIIVLLGWSPRGEREFYTLKELEEVLRPRGAEQVALDLRHGQAELVQRRVHPQARPPRTTSKRATPWLATRCSTPQKFDFKRLGGAAAEPHGGVQPAAGDGRLPGGDAGVRATKLYVNKKQKTTLESPGQGARGWFGPVLEGISDWTEAESARPRDGRHPGQRA